MAEMRREMSNKLKSLRFREMVALYLRGEGHDGAKMKPDRAGRISIALREDDHVGDIWGLSGDWLVNTRNEVTRDLSTALDEAQKDARTDEKKHAAVVWYRPARSAGDSYVLMTLQDFSEAIAKNGRPCHSK